MRPLISLKPTRPPAIPCEPTETVVHSSSPWPPAEDLRIVPSFQPTRPPTVLVMHELLAEQSDEALLAAMALTFPLACDLAISPKLMPTSPPSVTPVPRLVTFPVACERQIRPTVCELLSFALANSPPIANGNPFMPASPPPHAFEPTVTSPRADERAMSPRLAPTSPPA